VPWQFEITTGTMYAPDGSVAGTGYTGGDCGKAPEAVDNPAYESVANTGPLPEGWYTIGNPVTGTQLGPMALPLHPDAMDDMMGRGDFYIHGDTIEHNESASEGCIIMPLTTRQLICESADRRLQVIGKRPLALFVDPKGRFLAQAVN
jgi:hypothetical protein